MPSYGKRARLSGRLAEVAAPSLSNIASQYAEHALNNHRADGTHVPSTTLRGKEEGASTCDGPGSDDGLIEECSRATVKRSASVLDVLMWKEGVSDVVTIKKKPQQTRGKGGGDGMQQMFLDFGQKNFSSKTCSVCGMVYCPGLPEEEAMHAREHKRVTHGIEFRGWKDEHVSRAFQDGSRIVCVRHEDSAAHRKKAEEVREIVQAELGSGFSTSRDGMASFGVGSGSQMCLYVSAEKRVVGFLAAEGIRRAYRLRTRASSSEGRATECCADDVKEEELLELSREEEPALCGVSEIWVHSLYRRQGVAMRLLETLLISFSPPMRVAKSCVAFSQPTPSGRRLASKFFGTDSFLVYRSTA